MSIQTATNSFLVPPKVKSAGLSHQLLSGFLGYEQLGNTVISLSEQAHIFRQSDLLSEYALILSNLPSEKYQIIGQYYLSLVICRNGLGEVDKAEAILEKVASVAPLKYRTQARVSLSAISWVKNQPSNTFKYCIEAIKMGSFDLTTVQALRGIAILKSREGFHRSSLRDLENLYPIMKYTPPHIYLDYLNSLAAELAECGRLEEARNITKITCSSPLIIVYPEWRETSDEIDLRGYRSSRSVVSFAQKPIRQNVLYLPERSCDIEEYSPNPFQPQASVVSLDKWKSKMVKEPNGNDEIDFNKMTDKEKLFKIIELSSNEDITDDQLDRILDAVIRITSKRT